MNHRALLLRIAERDRWICGLCGRTVCPDTEWPQPMAATVDHIRPASAGGSDIDENLRLAHKICNEWRDTARDLTGPPDRRPRAVADATGRRRFAPWRRGYPVVRRRPR